jgi:putative hydrolase of the HAD superfamily
MPGAPRAVLFDIDDTLYSTAGFASRARRNAMEAMVALGGLTVGAEDLYAELREVIAEFGSNFEGHFDRLLRRYPPDALGGHPREILVAAAVAAYHDTKQAELHPFPGAVELLRDLSRAGVRVGIVTEGLEVKQAEKIVRLGIYPFLDRRGIVISDAIGVSKPNPKIWARALGALGVAAADAVAVGDSPSADIGPARSLGIRTVRLRHPGGKNAALPCDPPPDHEAGDYAALRGVLRQALGLPL